MLISIGKVDTLIGVSISTLRRWEGENYLLPEYRTKGGHRRYCLRHIKEMFLGQSFEDRINVGYARVSSSDQRDDLIRQSKIVEDYLATKNLDFLLMSDVGSGLNTEKRGIKKLLDLILQGRVNQLVLTHEDRLLRFGNNIFFQVCRFMGTSVTVLFQTDHKSFELKLAQDVIAIMTSACAKLYGRRAHQKARLAA